MTEEKKQILEFITQYLEKNPDVRFGQALFNLRINEFEALSKPGELVIRDIYNDEDSKILERMWVGDKHEYQFEVE